MPQPTDLLQGTLDMLILKAIATAPQHGWAIAQRIQVVSGNVLQIGQGSLYPALQASSMQRISRVPQHGLGMCDKRTDSDYSIHSALVMMRG